MLIFVALVVLWRGFTLALDDPWIYPWLGLRADVNGFDLELVASAIVEVVEEFVLVHQPELAAHRCGGQAPGIRVGAGGG